MEQVQSTNRELTADESKTRKIAFGELTEDEMKVVSGGACINHEIHAQGSAD